METIKTIFYFLWYSKELFSTMMAYHCGRYFVFRECSSHFLQWLDYEVSSLEEESISDDLWGYIDQLDDEIEMRVRRGDWQDD